MKVLNMKETHFVSGGDVSLTLNATVPTANEAALASLLAPFLLGTLDAAALGAALAADPGDFNAMSISSIRLGNFIITHNG